MIRLGDLPLSVEDEVVDLAKQGEERHGFMRGGGRSFLLRVEVSDK